MANPNQDAYAALIELFANGSLTREKTADTLRGEPFLWDDAAIDSLLDEVTGNMDARVQVRMTIEQAEAISEHCRRGAHWIPDHQPTNHLDNGLAKLRAAIGFAKVADVSKRISRT